MHASVRLEHTLLLMAVSTDEHLGPKPPKLILGSDILFVKQSV
jgi:hypothetical protein